MQVNSINSVNFGTNASYNKQFSGLLKDNTKVVVQLNRDSLDTINTINCFHLNKKNEIIGGIGHHNFLGISTAAIDKFLAKLQVHAKEGVDFFEEFTQALK